VTLAIVVAASGARSASAGPPVAITDVTIVDVEHARRIGPRTVVIDGGHIVAITAPHLARIPAGAQRVDGRGRFVIPGLVDMHVHLFNNASRRPPNDWAFPLFVASGVTAVREMNAGPIATVQRWRTAIDRGELVAPRILAVGVAVRGRVPRAEVAAAADAGADFIKVFSELPAPSWATIVEAARARGLTVAGHAPAGVALRVTADGGQRSVEHLMQAYEACSTIEARLLDDRRDLTGDELIARRDAQEPAALAAFDRRTCARVAGQLAATGQAQVPTLVLASDAAQPPRGPAREDPRWRYLRPDERARWERLLAAPAEDAGLARRRWQVSLQIVAVLQRAGVMLLAGTDAPMPRIYPGDALHDELARLVEAGLTPVEALRAATLAPARFFGIADRAGTVTIGRRADLVLLDADPTVDIHNTRAIHAVVLDGRLLDRVALDDLLAGAAAAAAVPARRTPTGLRGWIPGPWSSNLRGAPAGPAIKLEGAWRARWTSSSRCARAGRCACRGRRSRRAPCRHRRRSGGTTSRAAGGCDRASP